MIPIAQPILDGNERVYVLDCLDTSWISSVGSYIPRFEAAFADFVGVKHALSCCNGTVALHLALLGLGVGPGDEVIVPTLTYVASANAVRYCGATPVLIDSEADSWNLDPNLLEGLITERTRGIIVVHLYGHPADMDPIMAVARRHGLFVLEDAAEAHGATYKGRNIGTIGDVATFSFYGNKILTTGEGGMVCTQDDQLAARIRQLKGQGQDPQHRYWFPIVGYNYRMTNIEAAIGLAQVERASWHIARRREVASWYRSRLAAVPGIQFSPEMPWAQSVFWLSCVVIDETLNRSSVMCYLQSKSVETRPFFYPMHVLPVYVADASSYPVATRLGRQGINLPSHGLLTEDEITYVVNTLSEALRTA